MAFSRNGSGEEQEETEKTEILSNCHRDSQPTVDITAVTPIQSEEETISSTVVSEVGFEAVVSTIGFLKMLVSFICVVVLMSCGKPSPTTSWSPTEPQARLSSVKLWIGTQELSAEVARTPVELATGMMFRTNMASNEAMLFILPTTQQASFFMRNTLIPLSCAYINDQGVVLETHDMRPKDEAPILSASANIRFVLEVNRGFFDSNNIGPGTLARTANGTLGDLLRKAR